MFKPILLNFLFVISFRSVAFNGDSLKLKPYKHILDLNCGEAISNDLVHFKQKPNTYDKYSYSNLKTISFNYGYYLTQKNHFYLDAGISYFNFKIKRELIDTRYTGHTGYTYTTYNKNNNIINYDVSALSFSIKLEYHLYFGNFLIAQKVGISYAYFLNRNKLYTYDVTVESNYVYADPTSPGGYSWQYDNTTTTKNEKMAFFKNYITPFYNLGIGYNIKGFVPYIGAELFLFNYGTVLLNYQAGVKLLF
jgi:hypothetical protein